jgi:N-acyl-D-glutamate deacylase
MPDFLDTHTHYDAELLAAPGLEESVRHGVTTVTVGSCSLSTVYCNAEDCGDLFSRVEALPREFVVDTLERLKTWDDPESYIRAVEALPLGPNISAMIGHSDMRVAAMGLGPSVDPKARPSEAQMKQMLDMLDDALDAGFIGLSTMTNPWDKLAGDRFRSSQLPSSYATWREYRRFNRVLRKREAVHQSAPNITTKVNVLLYWAESLGWGRKPLKTALITAADIKAEPFIVGLITRVSDFLNRSGADLRWQTLPTPFEVYADGIDLVVFEEFGAGQAALHLKNGPDRDALLRDPEYRKWFKRNYNAKFTPRVWHRDFYDAEIVECPDDSVVGKSIGQVADERGQHPVDAFLDLVLEHNPGFRWRTTIANHRPDVHRRVLLRDSVQLGFADSGAHLRNMAFYNFPLYLLRMAHQAEQGGEDFMSVERAVYRLTGELADWYGLDTGSLSEGVRADLTLINPAALDERIEAYHEAPMPGCPGVERMVKRNDETVTSTVVGGRLVWHEGAFCEGFGQSFGSGVFLRAKHARSESSAEVATSDDAAAA